MAGTIADKLQALLEAKADIAAALAEKHAVVPEKFSEYGDAIRAIPQNEAPNPQNPIKFVDYDGTLLYSYGVQEVLNMTSDNDLPELPERTGLTNQGWNYTLAQLQEQANTIGKCIVGCNYITTDGKTRFYITIRDPKLKNFRLGLAQTASNSYTIDWGDGSAVVGPFGLTGYTVRTHDYNPSSYPASYVITVSPEGTGKPEFRAAIVTSATQDSATPTQHNATTQVTSLGSMFDKIEVGDIGPTLGQNTFRWMTCIKTVNIPKCVTTISTQALGGLDAAKGLVIPSSVTTLEASAFAYCYATEMISLPPSITSIPNQCFRSCTALMELSIPYTVTSIGQQAFLTCSALQEMRFSSSVTTVPDEAFSGCAAMPHANFPSGISSLGTKAFYGCNSLKDINLSSSLETVPSNAFHSCQTLQRVTFTGPLVNPASGNCIGDSAFANCYGCRTFDLTHNDAVIIKNLRASSALDGYTDLDIQFQDGTHIYVATGALVAEIGGNTYTMNYAKSFKKGTGNWSNMWFPEDFVPTGDPDQSSYPSNLVDTWFFDTTGTPTLVSPETWIVFPVSNFSSDWSSVDISNASGGSTVSSYVGSFSLSQAILNVPTLGSTPFNNTPAAKEFLVKDTAAYEAFCASTGWSTFSANIVSVS